MKKILWILVLLILVFIGDRVGGWLLTNVAMKSNFRYSRLYSGKAKSDILLLGNSRGLIFYQPYIEEITEKSTFNFSYNGMPIHIGKVMVEDYVEEYGAPEVVLIDVTMCDRNNAALISGFNYYSTQSPRIKNLIAEVSPTSYYGGLVSKLYACNGEIFQRALFYLNKSDEDWLTDRLITSHYIDNVGEADSLVFDFAENEKEELDKSKLLQELTQLTQFLQSKNIRTHLVINPYYPPFVDRFQGFGEWKKEIEKSTGMRVHDYSKAVNDNQGFGDYQHLNKYGSQLYMDILKKDGLLP